MSLFQTWTPPKPNKLDWQVSYIYLTLQEIIQTLFLTSVNSSDTEESHSSRRKRWEDGTMMIPTEWRGLLKKGLPHDNTKNTPPPSPIVLSNLWMTPNLLFFCLVCLDWNRSNCRLDPLINLTITTFKSQGKLDNEKNTIQETKKKVWKIIFGQFLILDVNGWSGYWGINF